ncbi:MAG: protein phosphatase CheZ [Rhodospirillales bacterium]|nr:protein phosphatase CheZ [Rhodospirillales bacterium]
MSKVTERKLFAAERALIKKHGGTLEGAHGHDHAEALNTKEVLAAIEDLKSILTQSLSQTAPELEDSPDQAPELNVLQGQLFELRESIEKTKVEIASVRLPNSEVDEDRLTTATLELDAIVESTEEATNAILDAAEGIEDRIMKLSAVGGDQVNLDLLDEMSRFTIKIMEACNFQDLSGQRITKVIKTIKYLEDRIGTMIDIWGAEEFKSVEIKKEEKTEDEALLHGPQMKDQGVNQDDIDSLFD